MIFFFPVEQSGIQENVWNKWSFCHMINLKRQIFFVWMKKSQLFEYLTFNKILPYILLESIMWWERALKMPAEFWNKCNINEQD